MNSDLSKASRLLVVDDNDDSADVLGEILSDAGHLVRVEYSSANALQAVATFTPDVALLDIGLPLMDGYELARRLRALVPDIKLIAITGHARASDKARANAEGFHAHLVKPVRIQTVHDAVAQLVDC